jgi:hypothetical protein
LVQCISLEKEIASSNPDVASLNLYFSKIEANNPVYSKAKDGWYLIGNIVQFDFSDVRGKITINHKKPIRALFAPGEVESLVSLSFCKDCQPTPVEVVFVEL